MRRLLNPRTAVGAVGAWPLRLLALPVLVLAWLAIAVLSDGGNPWNDLVTFPALSVCVLVLAFGLFVGIVAWLVLRRHHGPPETAGSVTGLVSAVPLLGVGLHGGSGAGLLGWAVAAVVVALVVGLVTARDARRIAGAAALGAGTAEEGDLGREGSSSGR